MRRLLPSITLRATAGPVCRRDLHPRLPTPTKRLMLLRQPLRAPDMHPAPCQPATTSTSSWNCPAPTWP
jgi:hypothetical protein